MTLLRCPACGYSKEVPAERLPANLSRVKCPKCQKVFSLQPQPEPAPEQEPPPEPSRAPEPTTDVICPHCGNAKKVPLSRIPPGRHQLRCWQCGESFELLQKELPPTRGAGGDGPGGSLPPVIDLFARSWQLYKRRIWTLLGIYGLTVILPVILLGLLGALLTPLFVMGSEPGIGAGLFGLLLALLVALLMTWGMVAMIVATVDATAGIKQSLGVGRRRFWSFAWMFFLLSFIVTGGFFLLLIPGLVFMTWFLFAQYILVDEDERGMSALLKSREYVRGYFWAVLLRLLALWVTVFFLTMLLGWIPLVGSLLQLLVFPFTLLYQFLVFHDIRQTRGERLQFYCDTREKLVWIGIAALGYLVVPVAIWLADVPGRLSEQMLAWQLQSRGLQLEQPADWNQVVEPGEERLGSEPPEPQAVDRQGYRAAMQDARVAFDQGGLSLGPVALRADRFWAGSPPHQWLRVRVAELPNLVLAGDAAVKVRIERVLDSDGTDRYDPASMFEKSYFQQVGLSPAGGGGYEGHRDVYLRSGTDEDDIARIEGAVLLSLPLGIRSITLGPSHMGESFSLAGHTFTFRDLQYGTVELSFPGGLEPLLQVVGYNSAGQPLAAGGSSWSEFDGATTLNSNFQGELFTVKLIMAKEFAVQEYPFTLTP